MQLVVTPDRSLVPLLDPCVRHVRVRIQAPVVASDRPRMPLDIAFVLDRSGSMDGTPLALVRRAVSEALGRLESTDRFAIYTFDDTVAELQAPVAATGTAVSTARGALLGVESGGSTNLSGGWSAGCRSLGATVTLPGRSEAWRGRGARDPRAFTPTVVEPSEDAGSRARRVLVLTDGRANCGVVDRDTVCTAVSDVAAQGVSTSTLGFGNGFEEVFLTAMSDAGRGGFFFVAEADQIPAAIAREVGEALEVVARVPSLRVRAPVGATIRCFGSYPCTVTANEATVALPDLTSGQEMDVLFEVRLAGAREGACDFVAELSSEGTTLAGGACAWVPSSADAVDAEKAESSVLVAVAGSIAADARRRAVDANREHNYGVARAILEAAIESVRALRHDVHEIRVILDALARDTYRFGEEMTDFARKSSYAESTSYLKDRTATGVSRKRYD